MNNKKKYDVLFEKIRNIINEIDPIGLISGGAPKDEYDSEIAKIISLLDDYLEENALAFKISKIFEESFGESAEDLSRYSNIAKEILRLKQFSNETSEK